MPAFQTAAERAPFDTPIGPVKSQFGYHVILVTHATPTLRGDRAPRCSRRSRRQGQAVAQTAIDALLKAFKVHLDPRFGTWGLSTNGRASSVYEVTPPTAPTPSTRARRHHDRDRRRPLPRARDRDAVVSAA